MPIPSLTDQYIDESYQRLVQTDSTRTEFADGLGNPITFGETPPGGPNTSIQFNGNGEFSGSSNFTFDSGSNKLSLTGSLNITGSTIQVGNNTLLGNTLLSGSIIISGSTTTPTVQIYGNTTHNGYIRFDPVTTNIDTSISASYIYVSGSTNDLYFSQNGSGYTNTTRLRWLEGNLYTGLLNGGLVSQVNTNTYQISSGSGVIVNLNASYKDNPYPTVEYLNWGNLTNTIDALSSSFDQQFIAVSSSAGTPVIKAQGTPYVDGDYNTFIPVGVVLHQNRSTINGVQTFPGIAYGWKQRSFDFIKAFGPLKISGYVLSQNGSSTRGLALSGGTAWVDGRNYTIDPNNVSYIVEASGITTSKIFRYYQSGSSWQSNWGYNTNAGAGFTDIDPTQYSNAGTLTAVPSNHWSIQRVFYFPNSATKALYVYYGNAQYANKTDAIAAILTETFTEAPNTAANAIFVGYMLLRNNADFNTAASYEFRTSGLFRGSGQGGAGGGGATSPGGSDTQIQYNNNGAFGGVTNLVWNGTTLSATGSFTGSFTGNLIGSASYSTTASHALNGGVTQLLAGSGITLSPTNGRGQVTITSTGGGGSSFNTATGSYGSFYDTTTQTSPAPNAILSMSLNTTDISNGVSISGSTNPYNTYIKLQNAGVYDLQFSAQLDKTSTGNTSTAYIWLRKNGIDLAETNTEVELSQNGKAVAAWNWFLNANANDYYQIMWSVDRTDLQLTAATPAIGPAIPSLIATVNRVDQFLSNTGSFTGSFTGQLIGTSSWATNALTASLAPNYVLNSATSSMTVATASYALTASNVQGGTAGNIPLWATNTRLTSSYLTQFDGTSNKGIQTVYLGSAYGLYLDLPNFYYRLGSSTGLTYANLTLDETSGYFRAAYNGTDDGLDLTFSTTTYGFGNLAGNQKLVINASTEYIALADQAPAGIKIEGSTTRTVTIGDAWGNSGTGTQVLVDATNNIVQVTGSLSQGLAGNIASGPGSHAEGSLTKAIGDYSHAEGDFTEASGNYSHAEGQNTMTLVSAQYSHAEGNNTIAAANYQHVQGQWNVTSSIPAAFIVGNGTDDGNRSNLIYAHDSTVEITGSFSVQNAAEFLGSITMILGNYGDDTEAAANGVPVNGLYRNGNVVSIRVS
jgi:hypothetical protein